MTFNPKNIKGRQPLIDYSWRGEIDRLLIWLKDKNTDTQAFCFDLIFRSQSHAIFLSAN